MVTDSCQKRFVMNIMQLRQCFARAKPLYCLAFFDFQKKSKMFIKAEFQNLASKKPNWQPHIFPSQAKVLLELFCHYIGEPIWQN